MKTTRKDFIGSLLAAGFFPRLLAETAENTSKMPSYYYPYLNDIISRIKANANDCDTGFYFITDQHVKSNHCQSGKICSELIGKTGIGNVLCGGDLVEAFGKDYPTDNDAIVFAIENFRKHWVEPIRASGGKLYCAKGNHDFTVRHSMDANEPATGLTYSGTEAKRLIVDEWTEKGIITNTSDDSACYYYKDDNDAKIRFIVADTTDTEKAGKTPWGVIYGVHDTQLVWLCSQAFGTVPAGYNVVVMHHIPVAGIVGTDSEKNVFRNFRALLEAYQNREKFTVAGKNFDFAHANGRILIDLTGHMHAERQTYQRGILHVTEPCDAAYRDYQFGSQPWCDNLPNKLKGTIFEQTFDAVQISKDRSFIRITRIGGGTDRAIHLTEQKVKAGGTLKLVPTLMKGAFTFFCHDGDRIDFEPNPQNKWNPLPKYKTDFAAITPDGVLTGVKPGPVLVLAIDKNGNKEIFPVSVY